MPPTTRRTADDWVDAAFARFAVEGLSAVRVEVLARDLGATKGSFYWHFSDRAALVAAVVERWERQQTDRFITTAEQVGERTGPRLRLVRLFAAVAADPLRGEDRLYLEAAGEGVADAVARVSRRRVAYVAAALEELGASPDAAQQRATLALAAALGLDQLARVGVVGERTERPLAASGLLDLLIAGLREPSS